MMHVFVFGNRNHYLLVLDYFSHVTRCNGDLGQFHYPIYGFILYRFHI